MRNNKYDDIYEKFLFNSMFGWHDDSTSAAVLGSKLELKKLYYTIQIYVCTYA